MLNAEPNIVSIQHSTFNLMVARKGFEPLQTEPKSVVLPLDDRAISRLGTAKIDFFISPYKKSPNFFMVNNRLIIRIFNFLPLLRTGRAFRFVTMKPIFRASTGSQCAD